MAAFNVEQQSGSDFEHGAFNLEAESSDDVVLPLGGREIRSRSLRLRWLLGAGLALAGFIATCTMRWQHLDTADMSAVQQESEFVKPFKQCGGESYEGNTCCKTGCACIVQDQYFSQCQAPGGGKTCSVEKAKAEVQRAAELKIEAGPEAVDALAAAKKAVGVAKEAKEELAKAQEQYEVMVKKGRFAREAKAAKEKLVTDAKNEAKDAAEAADGCLKHYKEVKKEIEDINATAALRAFKQCRPLFGKCGPIGPELSKHEACCQAGCLCKWDSQFYGQCKAPAGEGPCDEAHEARHIAERRKTMAALQEKHTKLEGRRRETAAHAKKVDEEAEETRHHAILVGTKREQAKNFRNHKEALSRQATAEAHKMIATAKKKKEQVHIDAGSIKEWKRVASGAKCGEEADEDPEHKKVLEDLKKGHKELDSEAADLPPPDEAHETKSADDDEDVSV